MVCIWLAAAAVGTAVIAWLAPGVDNTLLRVTRF